MRPIDADELMQNIRRHCIIPGWCYPLIELEINDAPTIEAVPVVHGEWIRVYGRYCFEYECSNCGYLEEFTRGFCSNCGAKMKAV